MKRTSLPPQTTARAAGGFYLMVVVLSVFALSAVSGIMEANNPAGTARNVFENADRFRVAIVANLLATLCYVAVVGLLNELLRPVHPGISRLAVLFGLGGCILGGSVTALQLAAPTMVSAEASVQAAAPAVHALLLAGTRANSVGLTFFGCYCLLLGWLVYRSGFIPKIFGALLVLSGLTWLLGNLAILAKPGLAAQFLLLVGLAALGEILFTLWLLFKGVDASRWHAKASHGQE